MKKTICILASYAVMIALMAILGSLGGDTGSFALGILTIACSIGGFLFLYQNVGWTFTIFTGSWIMIGLFLFILKLIVCLLIGIFVTPYKIGSAIANAIGG